MLLVGCVSTSPNRRSQPILTANNYLQLAAAAQGPEKQAYRLKAAKRLIQDQQLAQARNVLYKTQGALPPNLLVEKQLIRATLFIAYQQNNHAITLLQSMEDNHAAWTRASQIEWYRLSAKAHANQGDITTSIIQRSQLASLLPPEETKQNLLDIWHSLQTLEPSSIPDLLAQTTSPLVRGWLSLTEITDQTNIPPQQLMQQLQQWQNNNPNHPAIALLPARLYQLRNAPPTRPKHIALLLPLKGPYAKAGNAIRNGFFAAYYYAKKQGRSTPTLNIIDTSNKNIITAYQEALQGGADFVVGPLTKNNIATLTKTTTLSVPTLALNTLPNNERRSVKNLYLFSLSPKDEAVQAATKAWDTHHNNALIITPNNAWGEQIANTFSKTFQDLGGNIINVLRYTNQKKLSKEVQHALNIDLANWRKIALKNILHKRLRFVPRRRKDIDMVFLVSQPSTARQIRPLLRFYYAGNLPVYATSTIYTGTPNPRRDHDLNGILFCDMPWVLKENHLQPHSLSAIRQRIQKTWPTAYRYNPKLFALGVDAYKIIPELNKMAALPQFGIRAATGTLYLKNNHHIYRKLMWSQIVKGVPLKKSS